MGAEYHLLTGEFGVNERKAKRLSNRVLWGCVALVASMVVVGGIIFQHVILPGHATPPTGSVRSDTVLAEQAEERVGSIHWEAWLSTVLTPVLSLLTYLYKKELSLWIAERLAALEEWWAAKGDKPLVQQGAWEQLWDGRTEGPEMDKDGFRAVLHKLPKAHWDYLFEKYSPSPSSPPPEDDGPMTSEEWKLLCMYDELDTDKNRLLSKHEFVRGMPRIARRLDDGKISTFPKVLFVGVIRNGKTTLIEQLLGSRIEERKLERGAKAMYGLTRGVSAYDYEYKGTKMTLIDVPGTGDENVDPNSVLRALEGNYDKNYAAIVHVIDAGSGDPVMGCGLSPRAFLTKVMQLAFKNNGNWHDKTILVGSKWDLATMQTAGKHAGAFLQDMADRIQNDLSIRAEIPEKNRFIKTGNIQSQGHQEQSTQEQPPDDQGEKQDVEEPVADPQEGAGPVADAADPGNPGKQSSVFGFSLPTVPVPNLLKKTKDKEKPLTEEEKKQRDAQMYLDRIRTRLKELVDEKTPITFHRPRAAEIKGLQLQGTNYVNWYLVICVLGVAILIGFVGYPVFFPLCHDGMQFTGHKWNWLLHSLSAHPCVAAPCTVPHSNRLNGTACRCADGYAGTISWTEAEQQGVCMLAPCHVANSNRLPGWHCKCLHRFTNDMNGQIVWNGPTASSLCDPVCDTSDGNDVVVDPNGTKHCRPAPCPVANSNGLAGTACRCRDGFVGEVRWQGGSVSGQCDPAPCNVRFSNGLAGPACDCRSGFSGVVQWVGSQARGDCVVTCPSDGFIHSADGSRCIPAPCSDVAHSTGTGPECRCKDGFNGNISWRGSKPSGTCSPAPCHVKNSNQLPGLLCTCQDGFYGQVVWDGPQAQGNCTSGCPHYGFFPAFVHGRHVCRPVPCNLQGSNRVPGLGCKCTDGYRGQIDWEAEKPTNTSKCSPAFCNITYSNQEPGPGCKCLPGTLGEIKWSGRQVMGPCVPQVCEINNTVGRGPNARCMDGFVGTISWLLNSSQNSTCTGSCEPAPCSVSNSNGRPGPECACADGFAGTVAWQGPTAMGHCQSARCPIEHSTGYPGLACACKEGYRGEITWQGGTASGSCEFISCDLPGVDGHTCEAGYTGNVTWRGTECNSTCVFSAVPATAQISWTVAASVLGFTLFASCGAAPAV